MPNCHKPRPVEALMIRKKIPKHSIYSLWYNVPQSPVLIPTVNIFPVTIVIGVDFLPL